MKYLHVYLLLLLGGLRPPLGLLDLLLPLLAPPLYIFTSTLFPQMRVPLSSLQASSASRFFSISTKANPGGL